MRSKFGVNPLPDFRLWAVCLLLAAAALAVRFPLLEPRPMHTDEAVHALIIGGMLEGQAYVYNPRDFHGPAFYFLARPLLWLTGARSLATLEAWQLRLVPALTWSALILLLPLLRSGLGRGGVITAGLLLLIAAPFCYFSTDFIHESLFIFETVLAIAAGWRLVQAWETKWAVTLGLGLGLMIATKETTILSLAAAALASVILLRPKREDAKKIVRSLGIAVAVAVLVVAIFFTSFGSNFGVLRDLVAAGSNFTARADGQGHEKPWWTYLDWVFWPNRRALPYSGWILAVLFVAGALLARRRPLVCFLAWFTVGQWLIYSIIPYKTPWLELNFLVPMALVGGAGVQELWTREWFARRVWTRPVLAAFAIAFAILMTGETRRLCQKFSVDPLNPLAYAASSNDVKRLPGKIAELLVGEKSDVIQVVSADSWPLPWYLRKFPNVGYWLDPATPLNGKILILSPEVAAAALGSYPDYHLVGMYGTRPEMLAFVFVRDDKPLP